MAPLPVIVVLDNIRSLYNTGAFFRTADACAVEKLVLCGITPRPDQGGRQARAIAKTALGAEQTVPWEYEHDTQTALTKAHAAGYQIAVIETSADAVSLFDWTPSWPVCVVFGHEVEGVGAIGADKPDEPAVALRAMAGKPDGPDEPAVALRAMAGKPDTPDAPDAADAPDEPDVPDVPDVPAMLVRIPMFGAKKSLNVATAGGVVLYELRRRRQAS